MSIEWADNFSQYGGLTANLILGNYRASSVSFYNDPDGVSGGKVVGAGGLSRTLNTGIQTVGTSFRLWATSLPGATNNSICSFKDVDAATQVELCLAATGILIARRTAYNGTIIAQTTLPAIVAGTWNHIEIKLKVDNSTGTLGVYVNGELVINATGLDSQATANALCNIVDLGGTAEGGLLRFKDWVVWNTSGSQNNTFLGDCEVFTLLPATDDTFPWTSTAANGFSTIDETTPDDADYITASNAPPSEAIFTLTNLDADVTAVKCLITGVRAKKTDAGDATLQVGLLSSGDLDTGDDRPMTTSYTYWYDVSELDPHTAAAWSPTAVNAAKLQLDRTT